MLNQTKQLIEYQGKIRGWLSSVGECDEGVINETMNLMRTNPEYLDFILNYAAVKS